MIKRLIKLGLACFVLGLLLSPLFFWRPARELLSPTYWENLNRVGMVMRIVHTDYVDGETVDYERLAEAAMRGVMESLDEHSGYLPPDDYASFEEGAYQSYVGIGVEVEPIAEKVTVVETFPGGAAAEADIRPGDRIVGVAGEEVAPASLDAIVVKLRGEEGSTVAVVVFRPSTGQTLEMTLERRAVKSTSVRGVGLGPDGIGYLRISRFGGETGDEFERALDGLEADGMRALVIDLRDNPGGLLRAAVAVAGVFLERGALVVSTRGRNEEETIAYHSETSARRPGYPLAVLVNGDSASAAEIVAAALQDAGKAVVVGATSYGKGSVQSVYHLGAGDGIRQTVARYYSPLGRTIDRVGVPPDVVVEVTEEEERQLRLQRGHGAFMSGEDFLRDFGFEPVEDRPLAAARSRLLALLRAGETAGGVE